MDENFTLNSINSGLLKLHNMSKEEKNDFLKKVRDYAKKNDDSLLLELVEGIANPKEALKRGENLKIIGIDKDTLIPIIVDKDDDKTISKYLSDKDNTIAGLLLLRKK
jgi:hypothetical protein